MLPLLKNNRNVNLWKREWPISKNGKNNMTKTINVEITNIEWDFDGETDGTIKEAMAHLPSVPFVVMVETTEEDIDDDNVPVADAISDEYGWCVKNCDYKII